MLGYIWVNGMESHAKKMVLCPESCSYKKEEWKNNLKGFYFFIMNERSGAILLSHILKIRVVKSRVSAQMLAPTIIEEFILGIST